MGLFGALAIAAAGCGGGGEEAGGTGGGGTGAAANQVLRMAWSAEPPSLDPGLALDTTSSNVLLAIMDPLIRLNQKTNAAEPSLAESWNVSDDGKTVTYHLSPDRRSSTCRPGSGGTGPSCRRH